MPNGCTMEPRMSAAAINKGRAELLHRQQGGEDSQKILTRIQFLLILTKVVGYDSHRVQDILQKANWSKDQDAKLPV